MRRQIHDKTFELYISSNDIRAKIIRICDTIQRDYIDKEPIILSVLNGSFMLAADLAKHLEIDAQFSFVKLSSYQGTESSGEIYSLIGLPSKNALKGKDIIIVEDIIDTGNTLKYLLDLLKGYQANSIEVFSLLYKPKAFQYNFPIKYIGFEIPNDFVVGYGLDYNELGRNLRDIYKVVE